jgi:hypothetical protein
MSVGHQLWLMSANLSSSTRIIFPPLPNYSNVQQLGTRRTMATGDDFQTNDVGPAAYGELKEGRAVQLVMFGRLRYRELNGKEHATGFAIEIAPQFAAFVACSNASYEYYT